MGTQSNRIMKHFSCKLILKPTICLSFHQRAGNESFSGFKKQGNSVLPHEHVVGIVPVPNLEDVVALMVLPVCSKGRYVIPQDAARQLIRLFDPDGV